MKIVFRTDANATIGFGHLTRCCALAEALKVKGHQCMMIGPPINYAKLNQLDSFDEWIELDWKGETLDYTRFVSIARRFGSRVAVLDDYRIKSNYENFLHEQGLKLIKFQSNTVDEVVSDCIINANPVVRESSYSNISKNAAPRFLLGTKYSIQTPNFIDPNCSSCIVPCADVFVCFGGGDDRGAIQFLLHSVSSGGLSDIGFSIVSGKQNPRNDAILSWLNERELVNVAFKIDPDSLAGEMSRSRFCILAGGTMSYEAALLGKPMLIMSIADNQIDQSLAWEQLGVARYLGMYGAVSAESLVDAIRLMFSSEKWLELASTKCMQLVDGAGASRIVQVMEELNEGAI